jgi:hypothetical protein
MTETFSPSPLLLAMARMEGWLDPTSRCRRNFNPGDIEAGRFAVAHGATGSDGRFAIFPDDETGFRAMAALLEGPVYRGLTVAQAIAKYAPSNENDTARYIELVCLWANVKPDRLLATCLA